MKKKLLAAMLAVMAVGAISFTGCSMGSGDSTESSSTVENSQVISSEIVSSEESSEEIMEPIGTAFDGVFAANPIDAAYTIDITAAQTTQEIHTVEEKYASLWKAEIDHAFQQLIRIGVEGAEADQQTWNSSVDGEIRLIVDSVPNEGSFSRVERATKIKNFYRDKAKALYGQLYALDPDYTYIYAAY